MPVPFGFSIGDFIAGIEFIHELIAALNDVTGSSAEYQDLIRQLYALERAIIAVKHSTALQNPAAAEFEDRPALLQIIGQCYNEIDSFLCRFGKFQTSLGSNSNTRRKWKDAFRDALRKIEWRRYRKDEITQFKWTLIGHITAINVLMQSIEMQDAQKSRAVIAQTQHSVNVIESRLSSLQPEVSEMQSQIMTVFARNLDIYQGIVEIQKQIPPQVLLQQPVLFWDARGRFAPFHLEFINSLEAFLAVLKARFKDIGSGKIERGDFVITEDATFRDINLERPWESCFRPGQRVHMSVIFLLFDYSVGSCPACKHANQETGEKDIECGNCGRFFRKNPETNPLLRSTVIPDELAILAEFTRIRVYVVKRTDNVLEHSESLPGFLLGMRHGAQNLLWSLTTRRGLGVVIAGIGFSIAAPGEGPLIIGGLALAESIHQLTLTALG